jgi:hypothetical protein
LCTAAAIPWFTRQSTSPTTSTTNWPRRQWRRCCRMMATSLLAELNGTRKCHALAPMTRYGTKRYRALAATTSRQLSTRVCDSPSSMMHCVCCSDISPPRTLPVAGNDRISSTNAGYTVDTNDANASSTDPIASRTQSGHVSNVRQMRHATSAATRRGLHRNDTVSRKRTNPYSYGVCRRVFVDSSSTKHRARARLMISNDCLHMCKHGSGCVLVSLVTQTCAPLRNV